MSLVAKFKDMPRNMNTKLHIPRDIDFINCTGSILYISYFCHHRPNVRLIYSLIRAADMRTLTSIRLKCPKDSAVDDKFLLYDKLHSI